VHLTPPCKGTWKAPFKLSSSAMVTAVLELIDCEVHLVSCCLSVVHCVLCYSYQYTGCASWLRAMDYFLWIMSAISGIVGVNER
jgi:hypothetical protein